MKTPLLLLAEGVRAREDPTHGLTGRDHPKAQGQNQQEEGAAARYDIASVTSSDDSWWKSDWQWDAWDGASNSSRENWVYVSRKDEKGNWGRSDPWHRWHASEDSWSGRDGQGRGSGEGGCSEQLPGNGPEQGHLSGESEGEVGRGRGLPTGKIESIHDKADKEEEKRAQGKVSSSYPPVFKAKQGYGVKGRVCRLH